MLDLENSSPAVTAAADSACAPEAPSRLFRSFWIAGYESATHINPEGERLDMAAGVEHDVNAREDYARLGKVGIRTARDGLRWHLIDRGGAYDFSSFEPMLRAALEEGVQVIWDVCHYGYPDDVNLLKPEFVDRFARFSGAAARFIREHSDEIPFYSPVNEINFFAWAASRDLMYPHATGRDDEIKRQLVRAAIAGVEAIWQVDPRARISWPEPTVHVLPPRGRPDLAESARAYREAQFDAWDMIAGRTHPDLGGNPKYLDIPGSNFYHSNEWEIEGNGRLRWEDEPRDNRWLPYHKLLEEIWLRYKRPLYVAETSHFGVGRARWIREMAREVLIARENGVPVEGICLYPILDRYDWSDRDHWHNSGLWDFRMGEHGYERVLNPEYAQALGEMQKMLAAAGCR
jgi:beta-glucosidase/6-phospho-beta-glucosidase/beta-galactosidase